MGTDRTRCLVFGRIMYGASARYYPLYCLEVIRVAKNTVKLLDVVALTVDLPEYNLWRGQVGTVVELLADGAAFEV
jgi:hypothetical protein